jgi:predicted DNA-binding transcriptional regulator AlpA
LEVDDLIDHREVPKLIGHGVTVSTLSNWRYRGTGPKYIKIGRKVLYRRADLTEWLEKQVHDPEATR